MVLPILIHYLTQGLLVGINVQPTFGKFPCVPSLQDMGVSIFALCPIPTRSPLDLFSRYQVFHKTTLRIYVIILAINYVMLLSDVDIEFP